MQQPSQGDSSPSVSIGSDNGPDTPFRGNGNGNGNGSVNGNRNRNGTGSRGGVGIEGLQNMNWLNMLQSCKTKAPKAMGPASLPRKRHREDSFSGSGEDNQEDFLMPAKPKPGYGPPSRGPPAAAMSQLKPRRKYTRRVEVPQRRPLQPTVPEPVHTKRKYERSVPLLPLPPPLVRPKTDVELLIPNRVLGARFNPQGGLEYAVEYRKPGCPPIAICVTSETARKQLPNLLLDYYEKHIVYKSPIQRPEELVKKQLGAEASAMKAAEPSTNSAEALPQAAMPSRPEECLPQTPAQLASSSSAVQSASVIPQPEATTTVEALPALAPGLQPTQGFAMPSMQEKSEIPLPEQPAETNPVATPMLEQPAESKPIATPTLTPEQPTEIKPMVTPTSEQPTEVKPMVTPTSEQPTTAVVPNPIQPQHLSEPSELPQQQLNVGTETLNPHSCNTAGTTTQ